MFRRFFRLPGTSQTLGIELRDEGAALVRAGTHGSPPHIHEAELVPWRQSEERSRTLSRAVREMGPRRLPVASTLPPRSYQLLQVQAPKVKDSEMKMALGWQIKDLIDHPLQNTVIDYFSAPDSPGLGRMVYVVAADREAVREHAELLRAAGLRLRSIGIAELALRNIVLSRADSGNGLAFLHMERESGLVLIFKEGILYVARRLRSGLDHVLHDRPSTQESGLLEEEGQSPALESVLLDLQRTLDYFERNFRSQPVGSLLLAPQLGDVPELQSHLQNNLDLSVRLLDTAPLLGEDVSYAEQGRLLPALGSALKTGYPPGPRR